MGQDREDGARESHADPELAELAELAALSAALRSAVRRRIALGSTKTPAAPRGAAGQVDRGTLMPAPRAPLKPAVAAREPSTRPAPARAVSAASAAAELAAAENRERARACSTLAELAERVSSCTACTLCRTRTQTVFSDGKARVPVMFVGEAPGESEDQQGVPFVGRAGQLLSDIITKGMGLAREDVYIANVLKCRPPDNRDPTETEKLLCTPWLDRQIELVDPKVIIPLGRHAAMHVLGTQASMSAMRGRVHLLGTRKVVPTFHPAYLLRDPSKKKECWQDIRLALSELGLTPRSGTADPGNSARSGG